MNRKDFPCVFCFLLLVGDQCVWPEATKVSPDVVAVEGKTEDNAEAAESGMNPHFHRMPPPMGHMMPPQPPQGPPPPPPGPPGPSGSHGYGMPPPNHPNHPINLPQGQTGPMEFYPIRGNPQHQQQQYYSYNRPDDRQDIRPDFRQDVRQDIRQDFRQNTRNPEDETLQEMKQTMAAFSSMQKQFLNSFRTLQEPRNSPPIVELPEKHQEENSYDDSEDTTEEIRDPRRKYPRTTKDPQVTQVNNVKDVIDKVSRRKKTRPTTTTTVVQSVPQPVQQAVVQPVQQAVVQPVQQAMVQPVQTIQPIQAIQPIQTIQQAPVSTIQGLKLNNNLSWRNLLDRTLSISTAQQTFETIKSDMISALWTGLLVAAVKLAPLILICIKLVFKAILPLVGMSLLNRSTQDVQVQSAVVQPAFAPVVQPAFQPVVQPVLQPAFQRVHQFMPLMTSDTTTTTFQQDVDVDDDTMLDNEFESIKRHFYR